MRHHDRLANPGFGWIPIRLSSRRIPSASRWWNCGMAQWAGAAGVRRADLLAGLEMFSPTRLSRQLRRLLDSGVIRRVTGTYRHYLTKAGRAATSAAGRLTAATIIPAMI
jgi:hypothetical protein